MNDNVIQGKEMLLGEKLIKGIELTRKDGLAVSIQEATWQLINPDGTTTQEAPANISGAKVSAMVEPTQIGKNAIVFTTTLTDGQVEKTVLVFQVNEFSII